LKISVTAIQALILYAWRRVPRNIGNLDIVSAAAADKDEGGWSIGNGGAAANRLRRKASDILS
jgi:hypothetical protein